MNTQAPRTADENKAEVATSDRKEYRKPVFQVYGDLTELTRAIIGTQANDGATHPNQHFTG